MIAGDQVDVGPAPKLDMEYIALQAEQLRRIVGVVGIPGPLYQNHEQFRLRNARRVWMMGYDA